MKKVNFWNINSAKIWSRFLPWSMTVILNPELWQVSILAQGTWTAKKKSLLFFKLFLLPQEMCLHHPGGFFTIFIYSIAQQLHHFFMVYCHENKVWYLTIHLPYVCSIKNWTNSQYAYYNFLEHIKLLCIFFDSHLPSDYNW